MELNRIQEEWKLFKFHSKLPKYYDYPDGEDLSGKIIATTKWAILGGWFFGAWDAYNGHPPSKSNQERVFKICRIMLPAVGLTATYTVATYYATVIRKKDDAANHAYGGLAAGVLLGSLLGKPSVGVWFGIATAICGAGIKAIVMEDISPLPQYHCRNLSPYQQRFLDCSFIQKKPGNWTKQPQN